MKSEPLFSIVIPSLNEEMFLPNLLSDIAKQTLDKQLFEVIVVDGNSDDQTAKQAKSFNKKINLKIINSTKRNVSHQRNLGEKNAKGNWVVFMDADNRIKNDFLFSIRAQLNNDQEIDCFTCLMDVKKYKNLEKILVILANIGLVFYSKTKPTAPGSMIGIKKNISKIIKFDEKLAINEDLEYTHNVIKLGYKFKILQYPPYEFSLRRIQKKGLINIVKTYFISASHFLLNKEITNKNFYQMNGGKDYK